ncbi:hypothetical protein OsI_06473 [Oryza sativa Indica Group]|uniref:DUF4371 domain-containing protein n=1 Tax=Oryza sativa subsp. indica TaxID=39946 RepID=B8AEK4_ORYSI|nr:hypothetical protein OsI_06473 [Oryza sativa Indica Group]
MTPWNTDSDSDFDTRKKPIWRTYIFEFLSSHLLQPLAPASTCAQVLDQQLAPHHGSRHPAPPSLHDLNADPPAEDDNHIVHLHGEPLPQPPYFPEPKPPPTSTVNFIMENYLKRKVPDSSNNARTSCPEVNDLNWKEEIKYDPRLRKPIDAYHPNLRDRIQSEDAKKAYFTRLNGSISVARRLLKQGLPFRGHDESKDSYNKGNFLEFRDMLEEHDHALGKAVDKYGAGNSLMTSSDIQKDIVECFAKEILHSIMEELGHDVFCLLVDESRDVSYKEQMAVVLRYIDKCGFVKERFIGVVHVKETTSSYLKAAIDSLFAGFKLSLKQVRGQGYDGASNMRASPLDPAPPSLRDLNADPPAEDDDHIVHLHGEPLPQPPYFPEPNAAADLDGGLDGDAEASFPGSNPEADGRELDGDLEQDHSLFMFLDPGEVRCRKRLRASEEDDVDVGDARGAPGRCYDDDVAEDGRSTQSRYSWRPRSTQARTTRTLRRRKKVAPDEDDRYYYMDGEYGGAYDEEEHQQDDMEAADFHDGNQLSPEHQRVLDRLFGEADGSTRQEEQEAAAQGSGGEHVPPEEDSYEAAAVLAGDDVDEEQLQRQEQVDMTDGTDETF